MEEERTPETAPAPWFRRRPRTAAATGLLLFAVVTALRFSTGDEREATALLFALPVTLLALAFGVRAGTLAAAAAVAVLVGWVIDAGVELSTLGWIARAVPLLLLGVLVGAASDQLAEAERVRVALAWTEARQRDAAEINDGILQRLAVAKWRIEAGRKDESIAALDEAIHVGEGLVVGLLENADRHERRTRQAQPER